MQLITRKALGVGALVAVVVSAGCDSANPVYPVQGKVTFEGNDLVGGGSIAFVPLGNQAGKTAGGEIAADGTYKLTTYKQGDGSMAGEFRVVITQVVEREPEPSRDGEKPGIPVTVVAPADRIPAIYSDHQQSPLIATVENKSLNEINFNLKRDAKPRGP